MGVRELAESIKSAADKKTNVGAMRGYISGDNVVCRNQTYPYIAAIDCSTNSGDYVWFQLTKNGTAVILGA